ncbi:MAG: hypothetical protein HQM11_03040, partial [SAR324 cluster bacterium]|nr:hypothetical protein [SAR324 cluster bacterium]
MIFRPDGLKTTRNMTLTMPVFPHMRRCVKGDIYAYRLYPGEEPQDFSLEDLAPGAASAGETTLMVSCSDLQKMDTMEVKFNHFTMQFGKPQPPIYVSDEPIQMPLPADELVVKPGMPIRVEINPTILNPLTGIGVLNYRLNHQELLQALGNHQDEFLTLRHNLRQGTPPEFRDGVFTWTPDSTQTGHFFFEFAVKVNQEVYQRQKSVYLTVHVEGDQAVLIDDFESGDLSRWTPGRDMGGYDPSLSVTTRYQNQIPSHGQHMAALELIKESLAYGNTTTPVSQTLTVPQYTQTMNLEYHILMKTGHMYSSSKKDLSPRDTLRLEISSGSPESTLIQEVDLPRLTWSSGSPFPPQGYTYAVEGMTSPTDWVHGSWLSLPVNVSSLAGKQVKITLVLYQKEPPPLGFRKLHSVVLLDNIRWEGKTSSTDPVAVSVKQTSVGGPNSYQLTGYADPSLQNIQRMEFRIENKTTGTAEVITQDQMIDPEQGLHLKLVPPSAASGKQLKASTLRSLDAGEVWVTLCMVAGTATGNRQYCHTLKILLEATDILNHFLCREVEHSDHPGIFPYEWLIHDFFWGEPEQKDLIDFIYRNMEEFPISPHIQHTPLGRLNVWWTYVQDSQGNQRKCALA